METAAKTSIEEYLTYDAPEGFRDELIEGEIILSPDPKPLHAEIILNVCVLLRQALTGTPYLVNTRTNTVLEHEDSMPSADVFVIEKKRWAAARDQNKYPEGSPLLAIEIYSPSDRPGRLHGKIALYLRNGALSVWVVYPEARKIVVHEPAGVTTEFRSGERIPLPGPLSGLNLSVEDIFRLES